MKVDQEVSDVLRNGIVQKKECTIQANAFSFRMLSRQYSNPIKAILQEIGANAYDSHVRNGNKDVPFHVSLPNILDPHLRIRDFGTSMSEETMLTLYTDLMSSDKRQTNNETGCFGIGRITPLAYEHIDSFNIKTYLDGVLRLYVLCYNEHGIPELNMFSSSQTQEPNGVEVSFAVPTADHTTFKDTAAQVYRYFQTSPLVDGSLEYLQDQPAPLLQGDDWKYYEYGRKRHVIMGNIVYPVDYNRLSYTSLKGDVCVVIPVGSVSITPSRESLEYTSKTIKYLAALYKRVEKQIIAEAECKVHVQPSAWSKSKMIQTFPFGIRHRLSQKIHQYKNIENALYYKYRVGHARPVQRTKGYSVAGKTNIVFVVQDVEKAWDRTVRFYAHQIHKSVAVVTGMTKEQVMGHIGAIPSDNAVVLLSSLEKPPAVRRTKATKSGTIRIPVYSYRFHRFKTVYQEYDFTTSDCVYVSMRNRESVVGETPIKQVMTILSELKISPPTIVGISQSNKKLIQKYKLQSLETWLHNHLAKLMTPKLKGILSTYEAVLDKSDWIELCRAMEYSKISILYPDSPINRFYQTSKDLYQYYRKNGSIVPLYCLLNILSYTYTSPATSSDAGKLYERVLQEYPFIQDYIDGFSIEEPMATRVIEVINALDFYKRNHADEA